MRTAGPPGDNSRDVGDCPVSETLSVIGGRWKPLIMFFLSGETRRFGELRRLIPAVTQRMLTLQLRELEADGLVIRKVYPQVPPKVEYSLSAEGQSLTPVLQAMACWGQGRLAQRERQAA